MEKGRRTSAARVEISSDMTLLEGREGTKMLWAVWADIVTNTTSLRQEQPRGGADSGYKTKLRRAETGSCRFDDHYLSATASSHLHNQPHHFNQPSKTHEPRYA